LAGTDNLEVANYFWNHSVNQGSKMHWLLSQLLTAQAAHFRTRLKHELERLTT